MGALVFLAGFSLSAQAGTVSYIISSTGLTGEITGFPSGFTTSPFSSGGNTVSTTGGFFVNGYYVQGNGGSVTVTLASPTTAIGFDFSVSPTVYLSGVLIGPSLLSHTR